MGLAQWGSLERSCSSLPLKAVSRRSHEAVRFSWHSATKAFGLIVVGKTRRRLCIVARPRAVLHNPLSGIGPKLQNAYSAASSHFRVEYFFPPGDTLTVICQKKKGKRWRSHAEKEDGRTTCSALLVSRPQLA
jgi:hypothetical protein